MNDNEPQNFIQEFNKLPPPLKDILSTTLLGKTIEDALRLANVSKEKYNDVMDLTSEVLMLHLAPQSFKENLISKYQFKETEAQIITQVIQNKIFQPLMPLLKQGPALSEPTFKEKTISSFGKTIEKISSLPKKIQLPKKYNILSKQSKNETLETKKTPIKPTIFQISPKQNLVTFPEMSKKQEKSPFPPQKPKIEPVIKPTPQLLKKPLPESLKKEEIQIKKSEVEEIENLQKTIPEPIEIEIEKPIQQNIKPPPVNIPEVSSEQQEQIKNTLTKLMTAKKSETPKIVEEMEKIEKTSPTSQPQKQELKREKATAEISQTSKVIAGKNNNFVKEQIPSLKTQDKSSIFEIKIKETKEKKEELPKVHHPISYKKYHPEKPFGET